jgi:hypothetical protein
MLYVCPSCSDSVYYWAGSVLLKFMLYATGNPELFYSSTGYYWFSPGLLKFKDYTDTVSYYSISYDS